MKRTAFISICFLLVVACSVKEYRTACPVSVLFTDRVNPYGCLSGVTISLFEDGSSMETTRLEVGMAAFEEPGFEVKARRGFTSLSVLAGVENASVDDKRVKYHEGYDADCIFALKDVFVTVEGDEEYIVRDSLCRQVAPVHMQMENADSDMYPFRITVHSSWNGFDRMTFEPVRGDYSFDIVPRDGSICDFCLPRQGDDSLQLELSDDNGPVYVYPLGKHIARIGYDWNSVHLEKIVLGVNYSHSTFYFTVNDWTEAVSLEYII